MRAANRQPEGIPAGGQFAPETHAEPNVGLSSAVTAVSWDAPEDESRYLEAVDFMRGAGIEGAVEPFYTRYRTVDGTDGLILQADGRNMTVHHAGTMHPQISYGDDDEDAWSFRMEAGDGVGKTEHEVLHDLVASARHDAACQEAWRGSGETFQQGESAGVLDFGVRYGTDGKRVTTLTVEREGRDYELIRRGEEKIDVSVYGVRVDHPELELDALAKDFDESHEPGTGKVRFADMMDAATARAELDPGYSPRGPGRR